MDTRRLGGSGAAVSVLGLGCNSFGVRTDLDGARQIISSALDAGVTLFDTADVYGQRYGKPCESERYLGKLLGSRRKEVFLATKFGNPRMRYGPGIPSGGSRAAIFSAVEGSLMRLNTDWIDLYQMHMPDPATPIEETLQALHDLIKQGKVRFAGCSNFHAWQVVEAQCKAQNQGMCGFTSCQQEYSLLVRDAEKELIPALEKYDLALLPYFPLAAGLLTGKYRKDAPPPPGTRFARAEGLANRYLTVSNWRIVDRLEKFCSSRGRTLLELSFAWLLSNNTVSSVIAGATSAAQVRENVQASTWRLSPDEVGEVNELLAAP